MHIPQSSLCRRLFTPGALQAFPRGGLAYFNCGEEAGASQPHKHTQIVPLPLAGGSACAGTPFEGALRDAQAQAGAQEMQPFLLRSLPYESHAAALSERCALLCGSCVWTPLPYLELITHKAQ